MNILNVIDGFAVVGIIVLVIGFIVLVAAFVNPNSEYLNGLDDKPVVIPMVLGYATTTALILLLVFIPMLLLHIIGILTLILFIFILGLILSTLYAYGIDGLIKAEWWKR